MERENFEPPYLGCYVGKESVQPSSFRPIRLRFLVRLDMGRFCPLSRDVQTLEPPDSHHLNHAIGWLGLGCVVDARAELAQISPEWQEHPEVLEVRWMLLAQE